MIILCIGRANDNQRYIVTRPSLNGWAHSTELSLPNPYVSGVWSCSKDEQVIHCDQSSMQCSGISQSSYSQPDIALRQA